MAYDEELADRLREALEGEAGLTEQRMFGGLAFMLGGRMAVAVSGQDGLLLRCEPAQTEELAARPHAERFVMRDRPMTGWLRIDPDGVRTDDDLRAWVAYGVGYARSLGPK